MKKLISMLMVLCIVLSMSVSAFADGATLEALLTEEVLGQESATITLTEDVTWTTGAGHGSTPIVPAEATVQTLTIDGNGKTITAIGQGVGSLRAANDGTIIFKNVTIVDNSVSYAENSWEFTYLEFAGNLVFENVDFVGGISLDTDNGQASGVNATFTDCTFTTNEDSVYGVWVGHGTVSFEDCTFTGTRGLKVHEAYGSAVDSVTVEKCVFDSLTKKPGVAIGDLDTDTELTISCCEFINCEVYESDTTVKNFGFKLEEHTWDDAWTVGETTHWHECTLCEGISDEAEHKYVDGVCVCGAKEAVEEDTYYEEEIEEDTESLVVRIKFDSADEEDFEEIKVNLLKNGKKYDSEELSASKNSQKNWKHEWTSLDEDYEWSVELAKELEGYEAEIVNLRGNYWTITLSKAAVKAPVVDKANPETGTSDFVGMAAALAVVSAMGAVALNKRK